MRAHRVRRTRLALVPIAAAVAGLLTVSACATVTTATRPAHTATPSAATPLSLPAPTGSRPVGTTNLHLVDRSRVDPLAPATQSRELMVQLWYPTGPGESPPASYMSPGTASTIEKLFALPDGTFGSLPTHAAASAPVADGRHPLLLLSHGLGTMREFSTALAEELASRGYVVAAIDHPYDAAVVEFPDGRLVSGNAPALPSPPERRRLLATRVADVRFVLDELTGLARASSGLLAGHVDLGRVGALGHSFGGATMAAAMLADPRIAAGVDLDGKVWGKVVSRGLDRPFMIMIGDALGGALTPDQARFFGHLRGQRYALHLPGAGHFAFTDLGLFSRGLPGLGELLDIGTIDQDAAGRAIRGYVTAFFDRTLLGAKDPLLDGPTPAYPDVQFLD